MNLKKRLDIRIVESGVVQSRSRARSLIMAGKVFVNNCRIDKPGTMVADSDDVDVKIEDIPYVSRGGLKLEAALVSSGVSVEGLVCMDIGASTGGFTDCLLQKGAQRVYAIDVGYGQLAWKLRQDPRVVVIERTNIRYMPSEVIPEPIDLTSIDVSFISLKLVLPVAIKFLKPTAAIFALIKPQFEVGKGKVGKGGVVRDEFLLKEVIQQMEEFFKSIHLSCQSIIPSPILGPKGNKEFIAYLRRNSNG